MGIFLLCVYAQANKWGSDFRVCAPMFCSNPTESSTSSSITPRVIPAAPPALMSHVGWAEITVYRLKRGTQYSQEAPWSVGRGDRAGSVKFQEHRWEEIPETMGVTTTVHGDNEEQTTK